MLIEDFNIDPDAKNISRSKLKLNFLDFLKTQDMVDVYKYIRKDITPTWTNGTVSYHIDLAFVSRKILPAVLFSLVIDAIKSFYSSDHRILNVLFRKETIMNNKDSCITKNISIILSPIDMLSVLKKKLTLDFWNSYKLILDKLMNERLDTI